MPSTCKRQRPSLRSTSKPAIRPGERPCRNRTSRRRGAIFLCWRELRVHDPISERSFSPVLAWPCKPSTSNESLSSAAGRFFPDDFAGLFAGYGILSLPLQEKRLHGPPKIGRFERPQGKGLGRSGRPEPTRSNSRRPF